MQAEEEVEQKHLVVELLEAVVLEEVEQEHHLLV
jgi:hypothetical protein